MAHADPEFSLPGAERAGPTGRLLRASRAVFLWLTVAFAVATYAGVTLPLAAQAAVYLSLMGTVSLYHGGFEHVANLRGRVESLQARYLAAYVGLLGAALALFAAAPVAGLVVAVGITVLKAGHGGIAVRRRVRSGDGLGTWRARLVGAAVRGGAVMVVPYLAAPSVFSAVAYAMAGLFASDPAVGWLFDPVRRAFVGGCYAGLLLGYLAATRGTADPSAWRAEAAEVGLLVAFFAVVPPIVAVGVYFPCWYATRQVARMTDGSPDATLADALRRVLRDGALPWVGALAVLAGLVVWLPEPPTSAVGWVAVYSVFVACVAVPHVVVGSWLDRTRGIWSVH
ncbi:Brp/Blh family beta-carotene 15,15'-dioxygenase [Halosimplex halophilum]|uniref:Brp/Blh family beta-carotene 15,15'-dioxygenase n=1 Tax=Halosimplex halophilum TaxID=2559572 RepID=UPI00107F3043|nr:Brp/Blh family beta-carotene 15,15'-dioxygenase [Halosimplex halophilum]